MMDKDVFAIDMEMEKLEYVYYLINKKNTEIGFEVKKNKSKIIEVLKKFVTKNIRLAIVGGGDIVRAKREQ
jgi:arginine deiminase